jgi:DNA-binding transcriptional MerR regulator
MTSTATAASISEVAVSISQVAEATGLSTHTLRYYEREGLMLTDVDRAQSLHRRYSPADIEWVRFLTRLRSTAMSISEIREYVELVRLGDDTSAQRLELLLRHRTIVLSRLADMTSSLAAIDVKIAIYENRNQH